MIENQKQSTLVDLGDKVKGQIELPTLDLSPYIGKKSTIEKIEEHEGQHGFYIKIYSAQIDEIDGKEGKVGLFATRIFGLQTNEAGELGWGEKTLLGVFLKKMKVEGYKDLIGKEIIVQSQTNKNDGKDYLTF